MNAKPLMTGQVDDFDSEGTLLRSYLEQPRRIGPLASTYAVIEEGDRSGGVGANFIVEWGEIGSPRRRWWRRS